MLHTAEYGFSCGKGDVTWESRIRSLRALHFQKNYQVGLKVSTNVLRQSLGILSSERVTAPLWRGRRNGRYRVLSSPIKQFATNIYAEQQPQTGQLRLSRQLDKSAAMKRIVLTRWDHVPFFVFRTTWSYCSRGRCTAKSEITSCR